MNNRFEWWYLQVVGHGHLLTLTVHATDIAGGGSPYLSFSFHDRVHDQARTCRLPLDPQDLYHAGRLRAAGALIQDIHGYTVALETADTAAHLRIRPAAPPWQPPDGRICPPDPAGRAAHWHVPMPFGTATGTVRLGTRRTTLRASAYLDHNWGTLSAHQALRSWTWMALAWKDHTRLWACVTPRTGTPLRFTHDTRTPHLPAHHAALPPPELISDSPGPDEHLRPLHHALGWHPNATAFRHIKQGHYTGPDQTTADYHRWITPRTLLSDQLPGLLGGLLETAAFSCGEPARLSV